MMDTMEQWARRLDEQVGRGEPLNLAQMQNLRDDIRVALSRPDAWIEEAEIGHRNVSLHSVPNASRVPAYFGASEVNRYREALRAIRDYGGDDDFHERREQSGLNATDWLDNYPHYTQVEPWLIATQALSQPHTPTEGAVENDSNEPKP